MPVFNPYEKFQRFYWNPVIRNAGLTPKWTVSTNDKVPIDMWELKMSGRIRGAVPENTGALLPLPEVIDILPNAKNHTFLLDALSDGFVVLDIEPKCPACIKNALLKTPYLYGEYSMSGKGFHLIFPLPRCIERYPAAKQKTVLKERHGYFEILLNHYVTFTRNQLPDAAIRNHRFEDLFACMAKNQEIRRKRDVELDLEPPGEIYYQKELLELLCSQEYGKTPADFAGNDTSSYEFGCIGFYKYKLEKAIEVPFLKKAHTYTDTEKAWLLYYIAQAKIPFREKHNESRNGMPWLMFCVKNILANDAAKKVEGKAVCENGLKSRGLIFQPMKK